MSLVTTNKSISSYQLITLKHKHTDTETFTNSDHITIYLPSLPACPPSSELNCLPIQQSFFLSRHFCSHLACLFTKSKINKLLYTHTLMCPLLHQSVHLLTINSNYVHATHLHFKESRAKCHKSRHDLEKRELRFIP